MMTSVALRRTKNRVSLGLPEKEIHVCSVEFPEGLHKRVHETLYRCARECFLNMLAIEGHGAWGHFLEFMVQVLRVRQAACSAHLLPEGTYERAKSALRMLGEAEEQGKLRLDSDTAKALLEKLLQVLKPPGEETPDICAICLEPLDEDSATALVTCKHVFCSDCMARYLETGRGHGNRNTCPFCRLPFTSNDRVSLAQCKEIIAKNAEKESEDEESDEEVDEEAVAPEDDFEQAPKILALMKTIADDMKTDEKAVVFSQWTSYLDVVADALTERGIGYCKIVGSMNAEERLESMRQLENDDSVKVCLASLHCAGVGITLTRANHVMVLDPWW